MSDAPAPTRAEGARERREALKAAFDWLQVYGLDVSSPRDGQHPKLDTLAREFESFGRHAAARAEAEVARLKARLEIDHAYDGDGKRIPFPEGMDHLDGVACRDETIKMLEDHISRLTASVEKAEQERDEAKAKIAEMRRDWRHGKRLRDLLRAEVAGTAESRDAARRDHMAAEARVAVLKGVLKFYADDENYRMHGLCNPENPYFTGPSTARAALQGGENYL